MIITEMQGVRKRLSPLLEADTDLALLILTDEAVCNAIRFDWEHASKVDTVKAWEDVIQVLHGMRLLLIYASAEYAYQSKYSPENELTKIIHGRIKLIKEAKETTKQKGKTL